MNNAAMRLCANYVPRVYSEDAMQELTPEQLTEDMLEDFGKLYEAKEAEIGAERMREIERMILLRVVDNKWMDHIDAMDQLKAGIGLRAMGQIDPAQAYAKEGFDMFEEMVGDIKEDTVKFCYNVTVTTGTERKEIIGSGEGRKDDFVDRGGQTGSGLPVQGPVGMAAPMGGMQGGMPQAQQIPPRRQKPVTFRREAPKVGRNDPCPCGSGKKYKNCCGRDAN
jgi:preprotein translocase subunit SecA